MALTIVQLRKNIRTKKRANYSECHDDRSFVSMTGCDGHLSSEQAVKDKTGYTSIILNHLWSKQSPHLDEFRPAQGQDRTKLYWFMCWCWIHNGCTARNIRNTVSTRQTGPMSEATFRRRCKPMMSKMASIINEIHWENR